MRIQNDALWTAQALGASTITTAAQPLDHIYGFAVQAVWSGTPTGDFTIEVSCDNPLDGTAPTNWDTLPASSTAAGGASGSKTWVVSEAFYKWVRIKYVGASGTGSVSARINIKGV